ncbi:hypothetical protein EB796_001422 [Bugula neritina]|uniref:Uncharacterized protein n=1 Tax=Bugula neritina TaxID=10212 RepID=A0A7J7KQE0_BUGNE|nr:hypothetical protein EB796_001422 [Bugula neritina]
MVMVGPTRSALYPLELKVLHRAKPVIVNHSKSSLILSFLYYYIGVGMYTINNSDLSLATSCSLLSTNKISDLSNHL